MTRTAVSDRLLQSRDGFATEWNVDGAILMVRRVSASEITLPAAQGRSVMTDLRLG